MTSKLPGFTIIHGEGADFIVEVAVKILAAERIPFDIFGVSCSHFLNKDNQLPLPSSKDHIIIYARCLDESLHGVLIPDEVFDYEYLYSEKPFIHRDFVRFLSFILKQSKPNDGICKKARSSFLSLTFPDVKDALPNLEIVSIGADVLELRVDLLQEKNTSERIPRLDYVAQQLMALRRKTELPIIFTLRFDDSGGRWPLAVDEVAHIYLRKALQWGVEYIDVATSFSDDIKSDLMSRKGSTLIIASHHDLQGGLKWSTPEAESMYHHCCGYGDIVELVGLATCQNDNYDLEHFRSKRHSELSAPPLIAINTGLEGRFSRVVNKFLTPIKHPLLPHAASPSQLSAAEINKDLAIMGKVSMTAIFTIAFSDSSFIPPRFFEKCFNELCLPQTHTYMQNPSPSALAVIFSSPNFGGAVLQPPVPLKALSSATNSLAAVSTGFVDTISVENGKLFGHNAAAQGVLHTLIRDLAPSAYTDQPVLILSRSFLHVAAAIYALKSLQCGKIFTVGFAIPSTSALTENTQHCQSLNFEDSSTPSIIVSALENHEIYMLYPLLRLVNTYNTHKEHKGLLLDLKNGNQNGWPSASGVDGAGWIMNTVEEIVARTAVEMMKCLVQQSVPYEFVHMAGKKGFL